ncbi:cysteine hydrolase family protein [Sphingomonas flavalba]|uniref:cysteine hydrolase family protein n=1 Tax=Sphingomonas flavalba TaxID=2559804 RepID=UPI00109DBB44|nr:isochorismatase family cysteine hydrolase [Sphingomonas flavalba]
MTSGTVLLALHYQNEVLHPDGRIRLGVAEGSDRRDAVVAAAARLLAGARRAGVPIVHVRIAFPAGHAGVRTNAPIFRNVVAAGAMEEGSWGVDWHAGLEPLAGEAVVTHGRVNAFYDSPLEAVLSDLGATRLAMAGVATNSVVEHSARHAADMGYEVVVAADACSAARPEVHDAALFNIALIGDVASVDSLFPPEAA